MLRAVLLLFTTAGVTLGHPKSSQDDTKIVNGQIATQGAYPWQVSLQRPVSGGYQHFCGGSLISQTFVLTAAHCLTSNTFNEIFVYAGSVDKTVGGVILATSSRHPHPKYQSATLYYDYGLIDLAQAITLTDNIQLIPIPSSDYDSSSEFPGYASTTGWGTMDYFNVEYPQLLRQAEIDVMTDKECLARWPDFYQQDCMVCGGRHGQGICIGDSGGPLVQWIDGVQTLIGVTSWAANDCSVAYDTADGWAKVSTVRAWISGIVTDLP